MTTLQSIGYTFAVGCATTSVSLALFGIAVRQRCSYAIAPRCSARPLETVYNPKALRGIQARGSPTLGWIPWVNSLSYHTLLQGVPGTGTRKNGLEGQNLQVNLDGIVLLRFQALCLKVMLLVTVLCLTVILPLNITGRCALLNNADGNQTSPTDVRCFHSKHNITKYEITTLANIPDLGGEASIIFANDGSVEPVSEVGTSGRLYAIVLMTWIMLLVACVRLQMEWKTLLALRRVYYLEKNHWADRKQELARTLLHPDSSVSLQSFYNNSSPRSPKDKAYIKKHRRRHRDSLYRQRHDRDPWIPHPEQRETVVNVSLYSVLVGGLPNAPSEEISEAAEAVAGYSSGSRKRLDWQLEFATEYFDRCVPNQPGFSSSVAAITILPSAPDLAQAWGKWYAAAGKLRRLRFIRKLIQEKLDYGHDIYDDEDEDEEHNKENNNNEGDEEEGKIKKTNVAGVASDDESHEVTYHTTTLPRQSSVGAVRSTRTVKDDASQVPPDHRPSSYRSTGSQGTIPQQFRLTRRSIYEQSIRKTEYYRDVFGAPPAAWNTPSDDGNGDMHEGDFLSFDFGPEQTAMYSREFAQSASNCCPNGCCEGRLRGMSIDELRELEKEQEAEVHAANLILREAQDRAVRFHDFLGEDGKSNGMLYTDDGDEKPSKGKTLSPSAPVANDESSAARGRPQQLRKRSNYSLLAQERRKTASTLVDPGYASSSDDNDTTATDVGMMGVFESAGGRHRRRRQDGYSDDESASHDAVEQWKQVESILNTDPHGYANKRKVRRHVDNGVWKSPRVADLVGVGGVGGIGDEDSQTGVINRLYQSFAALDLGTTPTANTNPTPPTRATTMTPATTSVRSSQGNTPATATANMLVDTTNVTEHSAVDGNNEKKLQDLLVRESTYAVVTFTSRQAALTARQCLADGRGQGRWRAHKYIPVPPLADAPSLNICFCRGCCRPVSLSVHEGEKKLRNYLAILLLTTIYIFYTIPLAAATSLVDPENINEIIPGYKDWLNSTPWFNSVVSGFLSGFLYTIFFSLCPVMFKAISNFGSNATGVFHAEYRAMQYFWWFYVVTAFTGNSLSASVIRGFNTRSFAEQPGIILQEVARAVPTTISVTWLNWILVRSLVILPLHFLLQMNTFLFRFIGWRCCNRAVRGGGPGGQTPYRIYIDSGLVFMCAFGLAPASPLLAPCALLYFVFCAPLLKRNLIYVYRPNSDSGGARWPFLFDILISGMLVGMVLLATQMSLKQAYGPAIMSSIPIIPIYLFRLNMRATFLQAFEDCSLFHTSELDGLDPDERTSIEEREEYRQFLVDAHKAAYVPVCLAKSNADESSYVFTSEPAVVVPHENDVDNSNYYTQEVSDDDAVSIQSSGYRSLVRPAKQYGASMWRLRRTNSMNFHDSTTSNINRFHEYQRQASFQKLMSPIHHEDGSVSSGLYRHVSKYMSGYNATGNNHDKNNDSRNSNNHMDCDDEEETILQGSPQKDRPRLFRGSAGDVDDNP